MYMLLAPDAEQWSPDVFVSTLRECLNSINWNLVTRAFDRDGMILTQTQFYSLFRSLLPLANSPSELDIQSLWGGEWQHPNTQLSFAINLASLSSAQLDATTIPGLRRAFEPRHCLDGPKEVVAFAEGASKDPLVSLDAVLVIGQALWGAPPALPSTLAKHLRSVISSKTTLFICAASGIPQPWDKAQEDFFKERLRGCFMKTQPDHQIILYVLWKQDQQWLHYKLMEFHTADPITLNILFEHIVEHEWLKDLCGVLNGFAIDLAALAHRKGMLDFRQWAEQQYADRPADVITSFSKFLQIKAQDEIRMIRKEQPAPCTVSLSVKTVNTILEFLEENAKEKRVELNQLERQCMQAFPRLCNYGEGFDEVIEANGAENNILPVTADLDMQDYYKRMYNGELEVRHIIEGLRDCKTSEESAKQDLFACMIHGLFDEFVCFNEYPLGPLATTAVLFGGIINYRLINNIALNIALEMVLESVREYATDTSMYKFGLQALLHFQSRFSEWPDFCQRLVQIPGLQGTEPYGKAREALREEEPDRNGETNGVHDLIDSDKMTNGNMDDFITDSLVPHFRSVNVDPYSNLDAFEDPDASIQDKILFVLNNVTEQNLHHKITGITDVLLPQHFHWFASHLVEQRAKSQPNYQPLYLDLLGRINQKFLWAEVLRETFLGLRKILNAVSTMKNPMERTHLKHLGIWLGLLTLARDKPIKHKNLSFRDLLIEGWETSRLLLVIPFTCEVLAQGAKSRVFKPPNPWVMEVIGLLLELYDLPDLKIQQKFAVEVLLGTFGMPRNGEGIERSTELKKRQAFEDPHENLIQDNMEPFEELALGSLTKGLRNARLTQPSIQELENSITLPPASSTPINQAQLRHLVATAVQRSINEIIGPVVERSVTIATISTKDLICKDYAQEPSEERVREAFEQMAKALSGSLAAVTCKEPMRMSMGNYIRMGAAEMPEPLPEGSVLMCVNDNLEMACKIVEKQAADSAIPEIEPHVENEVAKRRKHKAEFPNEPYRDPVASHWSSYIPEPYKQTPGGLNQQQLDIYQHFAPQLRGNHVASGSADSGKQIPDVLQEPNFPNIPNLPTPAEAPAVPQQPQSQQQPAARPLPAMSNSRPSAQSNGYLDPPALQNHIQELIAEMVGATEETPDQRFRDLGRGSPVLEMLTRIVNLVRSSNDLDQFTFIAAAFICPMLYGNDTLPRLGAEVLVQLLKQMCHLSEDTLSKLIVYFRQQPDEKILNIPVTAALLEIGLLEFMAVDMILAQGLHNKKVEALHVLSGLLDSLLFGPDPVALRADFVHSLGEMGQWLSEDSNLKPAESIMSRLKAAGIQEPTESSADEAQQKTEFQMQYIFSEWVTLFSQLGPSDKVLVGFIAQLHERKAFEPAEKMMIFLRRSIDVAVESLERPNMDTTLGPHAVHSTADALASLIVLLVKYKGENATDGDAKGTKASYMKSILSLVVLVTNNHHVMRGEHFNQKAFFRIFSMVFFGWHDLIRGANIKQDRSMIHVFGETLLLLEPSNFPAFVYGWMSLVSHRIFMPAILKIADKEGSDLFLNLIEVLLAYVGEMLKPEALSGVAKELHRGVLRILLVLHHDFPEFLADNHFRLCNIIPPHCTQLRNLVLSAFPSSILELPDPFASGLKVDRLDDIRKSPNMNGDIIAPLSHDNLKEVIDRALASGSVSNQTVSSMIDAVSISPKETEGTPNSTAINPTVLHAIVIYLGQSAIATTPNGFVNGPSFSGDSVPIVLMSKLAKEFPPEARYRYLSAIANQLRYPNSHTHFFSFALLQLFGTDQNDQQESDVRQQITRILLERLIVHRPHPWGLIITLLELLKNSTYQFMELPFIKAAPEVRTSLAPRQTDSHGSALLTLRCHDRSERSSTRSSNI